MPKNSRQQKQLTRNVTYWRERFVLLEEAQHREAEKRLPELERFYRQAEKELDDKIHSWYSRIAKNNDISILDAKTSLNKRELEEFRWTVDEYIKYGRENAINGQWIKQLENAAAKAHITRLEALKMDVRQSVEVLFGHQQDSLDDVLRYLYQDGYYRTAFEVQKGISVGVNLAAINDRQLRTVLSRPWSLDEKTFSDRIWTHKTKLVNEVQLQLSQNIMQAKGADASIRNLADIMETSRYNAGRLMMTESAFIAEEAHKDAFSALSVEQVQIIETLDETTCDLCGSLDSELVPLDEYQPGVTVPPFHPFCRGTTAPYFDDDINMRAARDKDGNTIHVPADMKYSEWKEQFVKEDLQDVKPDAIIKTNKITTFEEAKTALESKGVIFDSSLQNLDNQLLVENTQMLNDLLEQFPIGQEYARDASFTFESTKISGSIIGQCEHRYDGSRQTIRLNPQYFDSYDKYIESQRRQMESGWKMPVDDAHLSSYTTAHEYGHYLQNILIERHKKANPDDWEEAYQKAIKTQKISVLDNWYNQKSRDARKEVVQLAKQYDSDINMRTYKQYISDYGAGSPQEFFAESFVNAVGGKPNVLGKAMLDYLKEVMK